MVEKRSGNGREPPPSSSAGKLELVAGGAPEGAGATEQQLRTLIDTVRAGVLMEDEQSRIVFANRAFCGLLDLHEEPEALIGWEAETALAAIRERFLDPDGLLARTRELAEEHTPVFAEEVPLATGRVLERDYIPVFHGGRYCGHFWIFRDISVHKEAQEDLRASGERLRVLAEVTTRLDADDEEALAHALEVLTNLLGLEVGLVSRIEQGECVLEQVHPEAAGPARGSRSPATDCLGQVLVGGRDDVVAVECLPPVLREKSSCTRVEAPRSCIAAPVHVGGERWGVLAFYGSQARESSWTEPDRDLVRLFALWLGESVERRRIEQARRASEARYRDLVEHSAALICVHDLEGRILEVNRAVVEALGRSAPEEIVGRNLADFLDPEVGDDLGGYLARIAKDGEAKGMLRLLDGRGRSRVLSFANSLRREGVERPLVRGVGYDITEQHEARKALEERAELEKVLVSISTSFINLPPVAVDRAINRALSELGRFVAGDVCLVFLLDDRRADFVLTHGWVAPELEDLEPPDTLSTVELSELARTLGQLKPYQFSCLEDLPSHATLDRAHYDRYGIRSLLAVPVSTRGELLGFVGLACVRQEIHWREEFVSVFKVVGDIIGGVLDRKASEEALAEAHGRLETSNRELAWHSRRTMLLNELGDLLQSSVDGSEAKEVIRHLLPQVYPSDGGAVYLFGPGTRNLEPVAWWGSLQPTEDEVFEAKDCWALRRGRPYGVEVDGRSPRCRHVPEGAEGGMLCIPLLAQGEALGLLHLRGSPDAANGWASDTEQLALSTAEHLALGLANLKLREKLRRQALRDPLTGLYNRRYLEDQFKREIQRAERRGSPVAVLMLDLDHFKRINDTYGHAGGDRVLVAVADLLAGKVRGEDVVARFGGEEFTVLLMDAGVDDALRVAETLRSAVGDLAPRVLGADAEGLSVSIGVAAFPECGRNEEDLLVAADDALYRAKETGRNRVMVAAGSTVEPSKSRGRNEQQGAEAEVLAGFRKIG